MVAYTEVAGAADGDRERQIAELMMLIVCVLVVECALLQHVMVSQRTGLGAVVLDVVWCVADRGGGVVHGARCKALTGKFRLAAAPVTGPNARPQRPTNRSVAVRVVAVAGAAAPAGGRVRGDPLHCGIADHSCAVASGPSLWAVQLGHQGCSSFAVGLGTGYCACGSVDRQTGRQTDKRIGRQTDRQPHTHTPLD